MAKGRQEAAQRNADITKQVAKLDRILIDSLALDHQFDWNLFRVKFSVLPPQPAPLYEEPRKPAILRLSSTIPIIEKLIPAVREKGSGWEKASEQNRRRSEVASAQYSRDVSEWRRMRDSAEQEQTAQIEAKKRLYLAKDAGALHQYWAKVLERSRYPDNFPRSCSFGYAPDEQRLIVDFTLPPLASLPQVGEVKYNQSRDTLEDIPISELRLNDTYCGLAIKIALRTIYELFQSDGAEALTSVAFNGRIRSMDVSTGHTTNVFVISIEASKAEFAAINLAQVDPKACFTRLKGVLSDNLVKRTPIAPIRFKT